MYNEGVNMKKEIIFIIISIISLIISFTISNEYISLIAIILCGIPIFKECIEGLKEFDIKADLLVTIAIISSIIIGEVFAAGEIATIMAIGGFLEEYTVSKSKGQIKELIDLTPKKATRIKNNQEEIISIDEIKINDTLKVYPGESIPTDGIIISGETSIDQTALTGESIPVDMKSGDEVLSGTINLYGSFKMKAKKISSDSAFENLIKLVESSTPENAKIVRAADKWATLIVVIAFTSAILTYLFTFEIIRSVTILVVFCPCALVLATPTAIMASIGNLTKYGVLVRDGEAIEELSKVSEIIFDKTGTLTYGKLKITKVIGDEDAMYLLTSLESKSEHPIAKSIVKHFDFKKFAEVNDFKVHHGGGITGTIDRNKIVAGNKKLLKSENIDLKYNDKNLNHEIEIFVAKNNEIVGKVQLRDTLRSDSVKTIEKLKDLGLKTTLLTGDNEIIGKTIQKESTISNAKFNCLPEDKTKYIQDQQLNGIKVAMIGEGINDAPSLKKSNVGISMGGIGSDISINASNITLMKDNINDIPHLFKISRKTINVININIAFSLGLNILAMILAIFGIIEPIIGALIHNIGSVIVIIYSSTLTRYKS